MSAQGGAASTRAANTRAAAARVALMASRWLAPIFGVVGLALLVWPQDFLALIGAGFAGSGSAVAIILLLLASLTALIGTSGWRRSIALLPLVFVAIALARENSGFNSRVVRFPSGDAQLVGTLIVPEGAGPRPALVFAHGSLDLPRRAWRRLAVTFAKRLGFVVFYFDKRGVGDSGGEYQPGGETTTANLDSRGADLAAAVNAVARQPEVDSARVGVFGVSQAGWVVPIAASKTGAMKFALLVSGPTLSTGEESFFSDRSGDEADHFSRRPPPIPFEELERQTAAKGPSGFEPLPYLEAMKIPSLWLFGEYDNSGPVQAYLKRVNELKARGLPIEGRMFAEANHGLYISRGPRVVLFPYIAPGVWDAMAEWLKAR